MESRAKQRLTGAVILVALFVLLVPELLTGPSSQSHPQPEQGSASDEGLRRYTIDLENQQTTASSTSGAEAPAPATPLPAPAPAQPITTPPETSASRTPEPAPRSTNPAAPAPAAAPASEPARRPAPATPPAVRPAKGDFVVQLGSFYNRDNADRLVRDMTARGFAAFVAPINNNGRELYRVRVGPTHDRASAEALAAELKRAGQSGSIVPIS